MSLHLKRNSFGLTRTSLQICSTDVPQSAERQILETDVRDFRLLGTVPFRGILTSETITFRNRLSLQFAHILRNHFNDGWKISE
jgi:hypothetical protein